MSGAEGYATAGGLEDGTDPDAFYKMYQDPQTGLHQAALKPANATRESGPVAQHLRKSSLPVGHQEDHLRFRQEAIQRPSTTTPFSHGYSVSVNNLDGAGQWEPPAQRRKSSFKDLVARFDQDANLLPRPMPPTRSRQGSLATDANDRSLARSAHPAPKVSKPRTTTNSSSNNVPRSAAGGHERRPGQLMLPESRSRRWTSGAPFSPILATDKPGLDLNSTSRRPLFGEVSAISASGPSVGYGIVNPKRRSGSVGSPMHSPNPMFPPPQHFQTPEHSHTRNDNDFAAEDHPLEFDDPSSLRQPLHHRAYSEFNAMSPSDLHYMGSTPQDRNRNVHDSQTRGSSQSRIPVRVRKYSVASESESTAFHTNGNRISPSFRPTTPRQHKSPTRNPIISPGQKSPSLRANIVALPPKVSPPLRSSRPRQPVSTATTAASRGKVADRYAAATRQQNDKLLSSRTRPPELADIDLKARRLKITEALSRSLEGQDLRPGFPKSSTSRESSIGHALSDHGDINDPFGPEITVPPVIVNQAPSSNGDEERAFSTPQYDIQQPPDQLTHSALQALQGEGMHPVTDMVGKGKPRPALPAPIRTNLYPRKPGDEPLSAYSRHTVETEGTVFDDGDGHTDDPHIEDAHEDSSYLQLPEDSLLKRIMDMRGQSPGSSRPESPENLETPDQETIAIMIRETQLFDDSATDSGEIPPHLPSEQNTTLGEQKFNAGQVLLHSGTSHQSQEVREPADETRSDPRLRLDLSHPDLHRESSFPDFADREESTLDSRASNAYTIINIFLQQQSPTGLVNQEVVDNIYDRIISEEPELAEAADINNEKIENIAMQMYRNYDDSQLENETDVDVEEPDFGEPGPAEPASVGDRGSFGEHGTATIISDLPLPSGFRGHRHKSSLDSPSDWADTSPSVSHWMQHAFAGESAKHVPRTGSALVFETRLDHQDSADRLLDGEQERLMTQSPTRDAPAFQREGKVDLNHTLPDIPPESPPPPPPISKDPVSNLPPLVPRRTVSLTRRLTSHTQDESLATSPATSEFDRKEQRRLNQRKNVMKELVDTEFTYERDMRVLCDIYKQTGSAALSEEDVKLIFGNIDQIQQFAKEFLTVLKQVVKPTYSMERPERKKDLTVESASNSVNAPSSRTASPAMPDIEKDMLTRVGEAFEASVGEMEKVYTEYIRSRHVANKRLEFLQSSGAVREWLKECSENSSDLTNAWSLDALLVKPIQRITKYPLLLNQLLEATPDSHPDHAYIRQATVEVTEINVRINEVKKHTELVDSVLSRRRKETDVRSGLTKAFVRRTEKLRQHVGMTEMHEDGEYTKLKIDFENNTVHLFLVTKDCQGYLDAIRGWVQKMCEMAAAIEAWLDIGHTRDVEAESKLRQFAMIVRGISSIALPDHTEQVLRKVIQPMDRAYAFLQRFEQDPKGLIQKRDKKLIDYAPLKHRKDRGEKLDRKTIERMEQWEALNVEAKERIKKLIRTTADLVLTCQITLTQLHMSWLKMCKQKFVAARAIAMDRLDDHNLIKEWQSEFVEQEAMVQELAICNGSLLRDAANMMAFLSPGTTLNGEDSPRQPSWTSTNRRTTSVNSTGSHVFAGMDFAKRQSGEINGSQLSLVADRIPSASASNGRRRAISSASGHPPRTPEINPRITSLAAPTSSHSNHAPPIPQSNRYEDSSVSGLNAQGPPRLSIDAPSPSLGSIHSESPNARPVSTATYFSALTIPDSRPEPRPHPELRRLNTDTVFSSAMPLSDSPAEQRRDRFPPPQPNPNQHQLHAFVEPAILFTAASVNEFNIDRARQEAGWPYLTYVMGEIFDVIAERGELWLARNQDDPSRQLGWIWNKHFAKLAS